MPLLCFCFLPFEKITLHSPLWQKKLFFAFAFAFAFAFFDLSAFKSVNAAFRAFLPFSYAFAFAFAFAFVFAF